MPRSDHHYLLAESTEGHGLVLVERAARTATIRWGTRFASGALLGSGIALIDAATNLLTWKLALGLSCCMLGIVTAIFAVRGHEEIPIPESMQQQVQYVAKTGKRRIAGHVIHLPQEHGARLAETLRSHHNHPPTAWTSQCDTFDQS